MALLNKRDVIDMMKRSREEIVSLRSEIDRLAPKAHAYDQLSIVLGLLPTRSQAYGEDVAHRLSRQIEEEEAAIKAESAPVAPAAMFAVGKAGEPYHFQPHN